MVSDDGAQQCRTADGHRGWRWRTVALLSIAALAVCSIAGEAISTKTFIVYEDCDNNGEFSPVLDRVLQVPIELTWTTDVCISQGVSYGLGIEMSTSVGTCFDLYQTFTVGETPLVMRWLDHDDVPGLALLGAALWSPLGALGALAYGVISDALIPEYAKLGDDVVEDLAKQGLVPTFDKDAQTFEGLGGERFYWRFIRQCVRDDNCPASERELVVHLTYNELHGERVLPIPVPCPLEVQLWEQGGTGSQDRLMSSRVLVVGDQPIATFKGVRPGATYYVLVSNWGEDGDVCVTGNNDVMVEADKTITNLEVCITNAFSSPPVRLVTVSGSAYGSQSADKRTDFTGTSNYGAFVHVASAAFYLTLDGALLDFPTESIKLSLEVSYGSKTRSIALTGISVGRVAGDPSQFVIAYEKWGEAEFSVYSPTEDTRPLSSQLVLDLTDNESISCDNGILPYKIDLEQRSPNHVTDLQQWSPPTVELSYIGSTNDDMIRFKAEFSRAVKGFGASDVELGGTSEPRAAMNLTQVGSDGKTYTFDVAGMSHAGEITARIPRDAVDWPIYMMPNFQYIRDLAMQQEAGVLIMDFSWYYDCPLMISNWASNTVTVRFEDQDPPTAAFTEFPMESSCACLGVFRWVASDNVTPEDQLEHELRRNGAKLTEGSEGVLALSSQHLALAATAVAETTELELVVRDEAGNQTVVSWPQEGQHPGSCDCLTFTERPDAFSIDQDPSFTISWEGAWDVGAVDGGNPNTTRWILDNEDSSVPISASAGSVTKTYSGLDDGQHELKAELWCGSALIDEIVWTWRVDNEKPKKPELSELPPSLSNVQTLEFAASSDDGSGSGIEEFVCTWTLEESNWTVTTTHTAEGGSATIESSVLTTSGVYHVSVEAVDRAGNQSEAATLEEGFEIDLIDPVVSVKWEIEGLNTGGGATYPRSQDDLDSSDTPKPLTAIITLSDVEDTESFSRGLSQEDVHVTNAALEGQLSVIDSNDVGSTIKCKVTLQPLEEGDVTLVVTQGAVVDEAGNASAESNTIGLQYDAPPEFTSVHIGAVAPNGQLRTAKARPGDEACVWFTLDGVDPAATNPDVWICDQRADVEYVRYVRKFLATLQVIDNENLFDGPAWMEITVTDSPYEPVTYRDTKGTDGSQLWFCSDDEIPEPVEVYGITRDGLYGIGSDIDIAVRFSNEVYVTEGSYGGAVIYVNLNDLGSGGAECSARYTGGSGTKTLTFRYHVNAGDNCANCFWQCMTTELNQNTWFNYIQISGAEGWSICDEYGRDAELSLPDPTGHNSLAANSSIFVDGVRPRVTINQAAGQSDPTNTLPILFDIEFCENVSGFTWDDIVWTGTATGISGTVSGSGATYTAEVTAASAGTLVLKLPADSVEDDAGNPNVEPSYSSMDNEVMYDNVPPVITGCPEDFHAPGGDYWLADWDEPIAVDNESGLASFEMNCNNECQDRGGLGEMWYLSHQPPVTVTYTATDNAGNTLSCSFVITLYGYGP